MRRLAVGTICVIAGAALITLSHGDDAVVPAAGRPVPELAPRQSDFLGAGSCSSTACHGSIAPADPLFSKVLRNEHTTWISTDAHSQAYKVLFDPRSINIVANLAKDPAHVVPAERDERCLACHSTPRSVSEAAVTSWLDSDAVGCESCHGGSRRWLGPHTTDWWQTLSTSQKAEFGLASTKDLGHRGRLCAGCHVGDGGSDQQPARDVNHDLIAAGHPRLNYELSAFLDNMPPHWVEKNENADPTADRRKPRRAADFPARAWMLGRLTTAEQTLKLLQSRATTADAHRAPWPEFAELDCFSCHHDLREQTWRRTTRPGGTLIGSTRWSTANLAGLNDLLAEVTSKPAAIPWNESLDRLVIEMAKPYPNPKFMARESRNTAALVASLINDLATKRLSGPNLQAIIARLDRAGAWDHLTSWDAAAQLYLALVPLRQSLIDLEPTKSAEYAPLGARLETLHRKLTYPPGFDSPRDFDPTQLLKPQSP
jgi:hypothetical protein